MNTPRPHVFDAENARLLCQASAEAYSSRTIANAVTDTAVSIVHCPLSIDVIVAFRGTADLRNWLTDLDCEFVRVLNFRVHRGFYEAMQAVELDLDASLGEPGKTRLWVTGHSLGGALAKLWALWAAGRGHEVAGVYTFGQPRVGDAAFASFYDSVLKAQSFRVVHADDIVPRVPWWLGAYRHAGHEVFFNGQLKIDNCQLSTVNDPLIDPAWPRKLLCDLPPLARELGHGKLALLDDHHVSRYQALFPERRAPMRVSYAFHP